MTVMEPAHYGRKWGWPLRKTALLNKPSPPIPALPDAVKQMCVLLSGADQQQSQKQLSRGEEPS